MPEIMHEKHLRFSSTSKAGKSTYNLGKRLILYELWSVCVTKNKQNSNYILVCSYSRQILVIKRKSF
jgi:hypothetical protein